MRLIDADALLERINTLYEWCRDERKSGLEQAMGIVYEQPTAVERIEKQIPKNARVLFIPRPRIAEEEGDEE